MRKPKAKPEKIDGLGPDDLRKIHSAVRQVWSWSHPRRLVIKRCTGKDGFPRCEQCGKRAPKVHVDHLTPVGEVGGAGYIQRMWCPSAELQGLCPKCHAVKTKEERKAAAKVSPRGRDYVIKDFY